MRLKKLGMALVVMAALGAVLASSALAAAVTEAAVWKTNTQPGNIKSALVEPYGIASKQIGTSTFRTTVSGQAIELHSTNIECEGCTIENISGGAKGKGKLKFTGVTVAKPSGCEAPATITTKALVVDSTYMINGVKYVLFEPEAGSTTGFASFELKGASCPLSTTIIPKGTVFVKAQSATKVYKVEQKVNSSAAINTEAGGSLHVGLEEASLEGEAGFFLTGAHEGQEFGTE